MYLVQWRQKVVFDLDHVEFGLAGDTALFGLGTEIPYFFGLQVDLLDRLTNKHK